MKVDKKYYDIIRADGVKISETSFEAEESGRLIRFQIWEANKQFFMVKLENFNVRDIRIVDYTE